MDVHAIQIILQKHKMDGYLLYDFHGRDILAYRILDLGNPQPCLQGGGKETDGEGGLRFEYPIPSIFPIKICTSCYRQ